MVQVLFLPYQFLHRTLASWHPPLFSCQHVGSPPGSSTPSIPIIFQQTGQFVGTNPLLHKGHNEAHSGSLSSLDLLLPSGPTSLPDRGECLDRHILAATNVKTSVCVAREPTDTDTRTCTRTHTHTPLGPCEELSGLIVWSTKSVKGEDFSCHTACSLGGIDEGSTEGVGMANTWSLRAG